MTKTHILLIGGGTGGHIFPLISVAQKLKELGSEKQFELDIRYFGDPGSYDSILAENSIRVSRVVSSKLRRYVSALNILDFFKFFWGFIQALFKLYFFMPEVVFSKSGPGVLPIIYAARWYRIPLVIHESDAIPGLTNKISAKHAAIVELAFQHAKQYFPKNEQVNVVGLPVRPQVINQQSAAECRRILGLADDRPVLFIVGGSQGAQILNDFVLANTETLLTQFEVVHQIGRENFDQHVKEFAFVTKFIKPELIARYRPFAFLSDEQMAAAFGAADIVISRAGSSIFEIAANGKPALLVPIASSANNHQFENAYAYALCGAGIIIEEPNLLPGLVFNQLQKIIDNDDLRSSMVQQAKQFYKPEASDQIAKDILTVAGAMT